MIIQKPDPLIQLYTPKQVAEKLGVCVKTIYRKIQAGELHAYHVGRCLRLTAEDLRALMVGERVPKT